MSLTPAEEVWRKLVSASAYAEADIVALSREQLRSECADCGIVDPVEAARAEVQWQLKQRRAPRRVDTDALLLAPAPADHSTPERGRRQQPAYPVLPSPGARHSPPSAAAPLRPFEVPCAKRSPSLGRRTPLRVHCQSPVDPRQQSPVPPPRGILCVLRAGRTEARSDPNPDAAAPGCDLPSPGLRTSYRYSGGAGAHDCKAAQSPRGLRRIADSGALVGGVLVHGGQRSPSSFGSRKAGSVPGAARLADPNSLLSGQVGSEAVGRTRTPPPRRGDTASDLLRDSERPAQQRRPRWASPPPWIGAEPIKYRMTNPGPSGDSGGAAAALRPFGGAVRKFPQSPPQIETSGGVMSRSPPPPSSPDARPSRRALPSDPPQPTLEASPKGLCPSPRRSRVPAAAAAAGRKTRYCMRAESPPQRCRSGRRAVQGPPDTFRVGR
eukprot:TRINITY_DN3700_c4_g1_i1.p1 TRINITY_DN3700_c4_g1~~TRINITY_DN3700_c4_g1_i1.p1  ORF type:complete len:461 (+),score=142.91 TRINITY_DN3700_c4_g1_i1:71-1384(+)